MGYLLGAFPPGKSDMDATLKASAILADAHLKGRDAIKAGPGDFEVGLTLAMFEWQAVDGATEADTSRTEGFEQTFGLVAVDRTTFERKPKPSAEWLGRCAKANAIVE